MVRGIGVDSVEIQRIVDMMNKEKKPAFLRRAFTPAELEQAPPEERIRIRSEYLAARFAVKEAVFKAVAHLLPEKTFDFRIVETLYGENNCPYVHITEDLAPILAAAGVNRLHVSITTEGDYATAFVVACRETESGQEEGLPT